MLAALPAMLLPRKAPAESAIDVAKRYTIVEETVEDWTDYDALAEHLSGVTSYHVGVDVGRPGGDETAVTVWQRGDGRFTDTHAWYLKDDVCIGDPVTGCCIAHGSACSNVNVIRTFNRTRDGRNLVNALRDNEMLANFPHVRFPPKRAS
jgi:hypothetical protein